MKTCVLFVTLLLPLASAFLPAPQGLFAAKKFPALRAAASPRGGALQLKATLSALFFDCDGVLAVCPCPTHPLLRPRY